MYQRERLEVWERRWRTVDGDPRGNARARPIIRWREGGFPRADRIDSGEVGSVFATALAGRSGVASVEKC